MREAGLAGGTSARARCSEGNERTANGSLTPGTAEAGDEKLENGSNDTNDNGKEKGKPHRRTA